MSYIFRLHTEGDNALTDWGGSSKYGTNVIEQIKDPNGESAKREITSIPSPFARIDLVKTALGKVTAMGVDGQTIHHKMVSDAFDIGQLFFECEKWKDQIEIIVWDKRMHLDELINSPHPEHQLLGKTYDIFLKQDGLIYNFDLMDRMYLLNFKNGPQMTNIIGATSPATLFFTSANDLSYVNQTIHFGNNDKPFDEDYTPLYKRDLEYQKFWYAIANTLNFPKLFPEVKNYLERNFEKLSPSNQAILRSITVNDLQSYQDVVVSGNAGNVVYIIGDLPMKQKTHDLSQVVSQSGFLINSEATIGDKEQKPLVLPVTRYVKPTFYASGQWDPNTKVPFYDPKPISERILPDDGTLYPYLTISDFLADTIIRMPYEIDKNNFFDGNINNTDGCSYLLPLTQTFFHFFTTKDLTDKVMPDGKKMFELQNNAAGVSAVLRIPVRSGYIEYRRVYLEGSDAGETKHTNDGAVLDKKFGMGIMPLVKFPENVQKHYRIAMFDKGRNDVVLTCIKNNISVDTKQVIRSKKEKIGNYDVCSIESYIVNENFDLIQVRVGNVIEGYILPDFKEKRGNTKYTFAVDFGTTNTHIEYCTDTDTNPVAFNITSNEKQLHKFHTAYGSDKDIASGFVQNFVPDTVGEQSDVYSFPMRTVFSLRKDVNFNLLPMALADGNIPFLYEKELTPPYNKTKTDLKWGGVPDRLLEMHLETLFILMRNKVVLNGGDLESSKVIWFYPASMTKGKIDKFKLNWTNTYKKYFGSDLNNVVSISESTAPYSYYSKKKGARTEVVTIDVGGGTTDVFVVENRLPKMLLSFRFASNAIFGDGYKHDSDNNGFVRLYKGDFEEMLKSNGLQELTQALSQIEAQKKSSDIAAFLFSLIGCKVKSNPSLNFLEKLISDDKMRYVFIVFYSSILYFIAKSMKARGLKKPLTLAFSGNGSHSLRIVSTEKETIARFAQLIFDGVYNDGAQTKIQVIIEENPKKPTCKGGILAPISQDYESIKEIKTILLGDNFGNFSDREITYADITPDIEKGVLKSVSEFFDFLFDLNQKNDNFFGEYLSADPAIYTKVKEICLDETELSQSLSDVLYYKRQEVTGDTKVEETLFFYPLIGILHDLALKISEM